MTDRLQVQESERAQIAALNEIRRLARDRGYFDGLTLALIARICREALDG